MTAVPSSLSLPLPSGAGWGRRLAGWTFSLVVTAGIFWGMSWFDRVSPAAPVADIAELKAVVLDDTPPPPPRVVPQEMPVYEAPLRGIEAARSESTVQIALPPPDVERLLPPPPEAPPAVIQAGRLHAELKPRIDIAPPADHVYQMAEVDQVARVLHRVTPQVPRDVRGDHAQLRVSLLFVVNADGGIGNVRVVTPSGVPAYDALVMETIKQWTFSPGVRRGVRVRSLLQQAVTIKWSNNSPFHL